MATVKSFVMIMSLVLAMVFAVSPPIAEARLSVPSILMTSFGLDTADTEPDEVATSSLLSPGPEINCGGIACCDRTICLESCPPQCSCQDIREKCHAACKNCRCTRSIPPQCKCMDVTNYEYARCPHAESK